MRSVHLSAVVLGLSVMFVSGGRIFADAISLNNGNGNQSAVESGATDENDFNNNPVSVNSLPYTTPDFFTQGTSASTTTPALSTSALTASFSQSITDPNSEAYGSMDIFFTANSAANYSISGTATVIGDDDNGTLASSLYDQTTQTDIYDDFEFFTDLDGVPPAIDTNVLNLATTGNAAGSTTGKLTAGDVYEFYLFEAVNNQIDDPTLTGNGGITFAAPASVVPLPRSAPAALLLLLPVTGLARRKASCFSA